MSTKKKDTTPVQMTQRDGVTMILEKKTKKASPDIQAKPVSYTHLTLPTTERV